MQGLTFDRTHDQQTNVYKKQGDHDWRPLASILYFLHAQCHIQKVRGSRLTSFTIYLILFTRTMSRTKSKRLPIDAPYHLSYAFYMHNITYKK
jgi:hypothetical protein